MRNLILPALLLSASTATAAVFSAADTTVSAIPDGSGAGLTRSVVITAPLDQYILSIELDLNLSATAGGSAYLGDMYVYLTNGTEIAVLANRPGARTGTPFGYNDDQSLNITYASASILDFHNYRVPTTGSNFIALSSPLTGLWAADGRATDPASVLDTDPRTAGLGVFNGDAANGTWSLFAADLSTGGTHQINNWALRLNTIPEPSTSAVILGATLLGLTRRRRS